MAHAASEISNTEFRPIQDELDGVTPALIGASKTPAEIVRAKPWTSTISIWLKDYYRLEDPWFAVYSVIECHLNLV